MTATDSDLALKNAVADLFAADHPNGLAIAVSGGGDSMALLDLAAWHADKYGVPLRAVTVDHGLRAEAQDEIDLVARFCAARGVAHDVLTWEWESHGNLQAEARAARYRLISDWARDLGISTVALAHTETDVAETFLMRLKRKSGLDGLARMEAQFKRFGITWMRPLLNASRQDLREYLARNEIAWAHDASNEDTRFDRVKARRILEALDPLGINIEVLSSVSQNLSHAKSALDHYHGEIAAHHVEEQAGDLLLPSRLTEDGGIIPEETLYRLRAAALRWVGGGDYGPRSEGIVAMVAALDEGKTHSLGGCLVSRDDIEPTHQWRVTREYNAVKDLSSPTDHAWDGRWILSGRHEKGLEIRALGDAIVDTPWRETGLPRQSLVASPAIWRENTLISAPLAGLTEGWSAQAMGRGNFAEFLISR